MNIFVVNVVEGFYKNESFEITVDPKVTTVINIGRSKKFTKKTKQGLCFSMDLDVSSQHAQLFFTPNSDKHMNIYIQDLASTNGTSINQILIQPERKFPIQRDDRIRIGKNVFTLAQKNQCHEKANDPDDTPQRKILLSTNSTQIVKETSRLQSVEAAVDKDSIGPAQHSGLKYRDEDDPDDFIALPIYSKKPETTNNQTSTTKPSVNNCIICDMSLDSLGILDQQLHINNCLDGKCDKQLTKHHKHIAAKKKKKKPLVKKPKNSDQEHLQIAMALSKSMESGKNDDDKRCESSMWLLEIEEIENQMHILERRKKELLKKIEKKRKLELGAASTDSIFPPESQIIDPKQALDVLFPPKDTSNLADNNNNNRPPSNLQNRKKKCKYWNMSSLYASGDSSSYKIDSIVNIQNEDDSIEEPNKITRKDSESEVYGLDLLLSKFEKNSNNYTEMSHQSSSLNVASDLSHETIPKTMSEWKEKAPNQIEEVFPDYEDNIAYLFSKSNEELAGAIEELKQKIDDINEKTEGNIEDEGKKSKTIECLKYFEKIMKSLITLSKESTKAVASNCYEKDIIRDRNLNLSQAENSVIVVDDSSDSSDRSHAPDVGENLLTEMDTRIRLPKDCIVDLENADDTAGLGIKNRCKEKETGKTTIDTFMLLSEDDEDTEDLVVDALLSSNGYQPSAKISDNFSKTTSASATKLHVNAKKADNQIEGFELMKKVIDFIKSDSNLYEDILVLEKINLELLHQKIDQKALFKCSKKKLAEILNQHGVTYKSVSQPSSSVRKK